jgi:excisionase family DNA binding protein
MSIEETIESILRKHLQPIREVLARLAVAPKEDELLSKKRAGELAGVCPETITEWIREGRLNEYGGGRVVRIKRSELLALKREERKGPMSARPPSDEEIRERTLAILGRRKGA